MRCVVRCPRCGVRHGAGQRRRHRASPWHRRQREVRRWLARGDSPASVAERLGVHRVRVWQTLAAAGWEKREGRWRPTNMD